MRSTRWSRWCWARTSCAWRWGYRKRSAWRPIRGVRSRCRPSPSHTVGAGPPAAAMRARGESVQDGHRDASSFLADPTTPAAASERKVERNQLAGGLGFEPRLAESESAVLPLDEPPPGGGAAKAWASVAGG